MFIVQALWPIGNKASSKHSPASKVNSESNHWHDIDCRVVANGYIVSNDCPFSSYVIVYTCILLKGTRKYDYIFMIMMPVK